MRKISKKQKLSTPLRKNKKAWFADAIGKVSLINKAWVESKGAFSQHLGASPKTVILNFASAKAPGGFLYARS